MQLKFISILFLIDFLVNFSYCEIGDLVVKKSEFLILNKEQREQCHDLIPEVNSCDQAKQAVDDDCDNHIVEIETDCNEKFDKLTKRCNEAEKEIKEDCEKKNGYVTANCGTRFDRLDKVCRISSKTLSRDCSKKYRKIDKKCYKDYSKIMLKCKRIYNRYKDYCESGVQDNYWNKRYNDYEFSIDEKQDSFKKVETIATTDDFFDDQNLSQYVKNINENEEEEEETQINENKRKYEDDVLMENKIDNVERDVDRNFQKSKRSINYRASYAEDLYVAKRGVTIKAPTMTVKKVTKKVTGNVKFATISHVKSNKLPAASVKVSVKPKSTVLPVVSKKIVGKRSLLSDVYIQEEEDEENFWRRGITVKPPTVALKKITNKVTGNVKVATISHVKSNKLPAVSVKVSVPVQVKTTKIPAITKRIFGK